MPVTGPCSGPAPRSSLSPGSRASPAEKVEIAHCPRKEAAVQGSITSTALVLLVITV